MTNTLTISRELIDGVPRELIEWIFGCTVRSFFLERHDKLKELRALLAATDDGYRTCAAFGCKRGGHYHPLVKHCEFCGNPFDAAPVVERQPDFWAWLDSAYRDGSDGNQPKFTKYNMEVAYQAGAKSSPPAPVAVVLPERKPGGSWIDDGSGHASDWIEDSDAKGWNACLDKVKELNR